MNLKKINEKYDYYSSIIDNLEGEIANVNDMRTDLYRDLPITFPCCGNKHKLTEIRLLIGHYTASYSRAYEDPDTWVEHYMICPSCSKVQRILLTLNDKIDYKDKQKVEWIIWSDFEKLYKPHFKEVIKRDVDRERNIINSYNYCIDFDHCLQLFPTLRSKMVTETKFKWT